MEPLADLSFLRTFTGGDAEKMKKYIILFLNGSDALLDGVGKSMQASDWPTLKTAAHSLKSQVKYMGIRKAEELAYYIEQNAGAQTNLDKLPEAARDLTETTLKACEELRQVLATL